jgi:DNA topoisomerase-1
MGSVLKLTTKVAMDAAQKLFEAGLITYHRTDSPAMSAEFVGCVRTFATKHRLPAPASPRIHKMKANAQGAHECLRVVDIEMRDIAGAGIDDPLLKKVYTLVWMITLQSQLADGENTVTTAILKNGSNDSFISKATQVKFQGWRDAAVKFGHSHDLKSATEELNSQENSEKAPVGSLPELIIGESLTPLRVDLVTKLTEPPAVFTEKSLVKTLEKMGIGRPSTFASTIEKILQVNYVTRNSKLQFAPTALGKAMVHALNPEFSFMTYQYTADIEESLDLIALGKAEYKSVVQSAWDVLLKELESFKTKPLPSQINLIAADTQPPVAGAQPERATASGSRRKPTKASSSATRTTKPTTSTPGSLCPECKTGKLQMKKIQGGANAGKSFIGCTSYPQCRFFSWPKQWG